MVNYGSNGLDKEESTIKQKSKSDLELEKNNMFIRHQLKKN